MIRRPPRSTLSSSSAASDVYKRQVRRRCRTVSRLDRPARGARNEEDDVCERPVRRRRSRSEQDCRVVHAIEGNEGHRRDGRPREEGPFTEERRERDDPDEILCGNAGVQDVKEERRHEREPQAPLTRRARKERETRRGRREEE